MRFSEIEIKILYNIQEEFPVSSRPFKMLLDKGMSEETVLKLVKKFKEEAVIRRISALFNSKRLGYVSTLVAMKVTEAKVNLISTIINEYEEVTHNYKRDDEYNLWFTLITPSKDEQERILNEIREKTGIDHLLNLAPLKRFKINTIFKIPGTSFNQLPQEMMSEDFKKQELVITDELDKEIFRHLQDISIVLEPYQLISDELGIPQQELFQKIERYKKSGIIRKMRAVLDHYKIGLKENVMAVFKVSPTEMSKAVEIITSYPQISHCYERSTSDDWQYNLFIVIHETTKRRCEEVISEILEKTGIKEYKRLYTKRELKKANPRYF